MATWAIGDVHGCFRTLEALVERIGLDPRRDRLWMVGDLVNRGPGSLEVLRWARTLDAEMGDRFRVVLGNHDLHLIARHLGVTSKKPRDTLKKVLKAADAAELIDWLRRRPFVHFETDSRPRLRPRPRGAAARLVEGGRHQGGQAARTKAPGSESEEPVVSPEQQVAGDIHPRSDARRERPAHDYSGPLEEAPSGLRPWFGVAPRSCPDHTAVVGHWAALGLYLRPDLIALDSGCVWGGLLTAVCLDDRRVVQKRVVERP